MLDPVLLLRRELGPGGVARNAAGFGVAHQVVLAFLPGRSLEHLDGAGAQGQLVVRDDQAVVDPDHPSEAPARLAGTGRRVEREHGWRRVGVADVAFRAVQAGAELPELAVAGLRHDVHRELAAAALQAGLDGFHHTHRLGVAQAEAVGHHVEHLDLHRGGGLVGSFVRLVGLALFLGDRGRSLDGALGLHPGVTAGGQPLLHLLGAGVGRQFHREGDDQARVGAGLARCHPAVQLGQDGLGRVVPHRQRGVAVEQGRTPGHEQLEVVVQLGHGAHGGARAADRVGLVDGNGRRHPFHPVHRRLVHAVQELPGVGAEGFHIAPLAFGEQRVEHQAGLPRTARAGDHGQLAGADVQIQVLEVVLARAADTDQSLGHGGSLFRG